MNVREDVVGDVLASLSPIRFIELDAAAWTNNTVRVQARNISLGATFNLTAAKRSIAVIKRRVPNAESRLLIGSALSKWFSAPSCCCRS